MSPQNIPHTRSVVNQAFGVLCLSQLSDILSSNICRLGSLCLHHFVLLIRIYEETQKYEAMNANTDYVTAIWIGTGYQLDYFQFL